jgi:hypothetical protein
LSLADPYLIPGTDVLRNKLGILDPDHLDRQIDDLAIVEASYLFNEGAGQVDGSHSGFDGHAGS